MGSISSRTSVVELRDSSSGGDNRGHSEANIGSNESGCVHYKISIMKTYGMIPTHALTSLHGLCRCYAVTCNAPVVYLSNTT